MIDNKSSKKMNTQKIQNYNIYKYIIKISKQKTAQATNKQKMNQCIREIVNIKLKE